MSATVVYMHNALVARQVLAVEPCSIRSLAPAESHRPFVAFLDGRPVLRADWELVLEDDQALAFVDVHALPQGGGGGSDAMRTVAMIALMVYAPGLGTALTGASYGVLAGASASMVTAGLVFGGMALINAVMPAAKPTSAQQATSLAAASPTYSLQAQGNTARLEAAIPEHFGRMMGYPDFAAMPYVEYSGNDQYLYQLLCVGTGEYSIEQIRIEDTDISSFTDVTYEIVGPNETLDLFPANVVTSVEVSGQDMSDSTIIGPFVANESGTTCNYLGFDFVMAKGLYYANDDGSLGTKAVELQVEVQQVNDSGTAIGSWINLSGTTQYSGWSDWTVYSTGTQSSALPTDTTTEKYTQTSTTTVYSGKNVDRTVTTYTKFKSTRTVSYTSTRFTGATTTAQRQSVRFAVSAGRYQARVTRIDTKDTSTRAGHDVVWSGMRAYINDSRTYGDVTLIGLRMKATSNLSSQSSRKINVIATRKLPVWTGSAWTANTATRSIAWAFAYACKSVGLTDAQIDLAGLLTLDATWAARGDYFDARFDAFISLWEAASKIAQAGRAKPYMQGGIMRVARDQAATVPVAMFSMRNIVKGSFKVKYLMPTDDTADSVKATYFDNDTWASSTVTATLADSTADNIAKITLFGVTDRDQAYREAMYTAAANRRRRIINFTTEMEGFIPSFLDLINVQHDMPGWGQSGDVVDWNASTKVLTLSETLNFLSGSNHYVALRKRDGSVSGPYLATAYGTSGNQLYIDAALDMTPYTGHSEERTHFSFGWAETYRQRARVLSAKPLSLTTVAIECVAEDENVHTADTGVTTPSMVTSQLAGFVNAPTVTGVSAAESPGARRKMVVSWQPALWADSYQVEQSADAANWVAVATTDSTSVTALAISETSTTVRVAAVGLGRGAWAQASYTMPALENVSGMAIGINQNGVLVTWAQAEDEAYLDTEIRKGATWEAGTLVTRKSSSSHLMDWQSVGTLTLWAKHFDVYGQSSASAASTSLVIAGPNQVNITRSNVQVNTVALGWDDAKGSQPIKSYGIYTGAAGATLADCTLYGKAGSDSRSDVVIFTSAGAKRIYVLAEDMAGNVGTASSLDLTVTLPTNFVLSSEWDASWGGTITNGYVQDGALILLAKNETWAAHFATNGWATVADQVSAGYPLYFEPGTTSASYAEVHDVGKVLPSAKISVSTQSTTLAGSVLVSVLIEWSADGTTYTAATQGATEVQAAQCRYVRVTYSATSTGGDDLLQLSRVNTVVSSEEKAEYGSLSLLSTDTAGTLFTCTKTFLDVVSVVATPLNSGNIARTNCIVDDTGAVTKVYVQAWDTSGNRTSGTVSLQIGGY